MHHEVIKNDTPPIAKIIFVKNVRDKVFCGIIFFDYAENMKKIIGAVWKLPAKLHSQSSPFPPNLGWIDCVI